MEENIAATPKVLMKCLDILASPMHENYPPSLKLSVKDKYVNHPDFQYFQAIKAKNNYHFHKYKKSPIATGSNDKAIVSEFDPFDRDRLISRICTFTPLNWNIPFDCTSGLSELKCAQNGWSCVLVSSSLSSMKNHLICTYCNRLLTLKYNEMQDGNQDLDVLDYQKLNSKLSKDYVELIEYSAHEAYCPWRKFETPLEVYCLRPYMERTNKILIENYLNTLKSLVDSFDVISTFEDKFKQLNGKESPRVANFIRVSKTWLVRKHYFNDKENMLARLDGIPIWIYLVAAEGWGLTVMRRGELTIAFLACSQCNKRIFPDDINAGPIKTSSNTSDQGANCQLKVDVEVESTMDVAAEHKVWCTMLKANDGISIRDYLFALVVAAELHMELNGDLQENFEVRMDPANKRERNKSFDIEDGLERLNKMRKLYLLDE